jgi:hypothetical protein
MYRIEWITFAGLIALSSIGVATGHLSGLQFVWSIPLSACAVWLVGSLKFIQEKGKRL